MHFHKLVTAVCLMATLGGVNLAQAQGDQRYLKKAVATTREWRSTGDPETLLLAYTRWEIAIRKDDYLMQPGVDKTKSSPTWQYFEKFCKAEYQSLLKHDQKAGMRCAVLVGERKEAEYWLKRQARELAEAREREARREAEEARTRVWLEQMLARAEQEDCPEAISLFERQRAFSIINRTETKALEKQAQAFYFTCEQRRREVEAAIKREVELFNAMSSRSQLDDAMDRIMEIDDLHRHQASLYSRRVTLKECVVYESSGEIARRIQNKLREKRKAQLSGKRAIRAFEAKKRSKLNAAIAQLESAKRREAQAMKKLAEASAADRPARQTELQTAKTELETAEKELAELNQVIDATSVKKTKSWSELDPSCQHAVKTAQATREFCQQALDEITQFSRVQAERCLLILKAENSASRMDRLQTLEGISFYIQMDFQSNPRAPVMDADEVKDKVLLQSIQTIEGNGGRVYSLSQPASVLVNFTVKTKPRDPGTNWLKVEMRAYLQDEKGRKRLLYPPNKKHPGRMYVEEELTPQTSQQATVFLCDQLLGYLITYLTKDTFH